MTYRYPPASTSLQGLIELAGDLDGYNSSASTPTIGSLTGDGYGIVSVIANTLRGISSSSSLTIGTNKSAATLNLQADSATTIAQLGLSGGHSIIKFFDGGSDTGANILAISGSTLDITGPTGAILRFFNNPVGQSFIELQTGQVIITQPQLGFGLNFQDNAGVGLAVLQQNGSIHTTLFQSGATQTSFTIGTNDSGADLILQAGAASTAATLTSSGISVNSLAGFGDGYVVVDNSGNLSFSATAGGGGVSPGTPGQIFVTDGYSDAVFTSLISYDPTCGRFTAGGQDGYYKAIIGPAPGAETTAAHLYLLPNATSPITDNCFLRTDGTFAYINDIYGSGMYFYSGLSTVMLNMNTSDATFYGGKAVIESTHGTIVAGGSGSDFKTVIGPRVSNETVQSTIAFLAQATTPTANTWSVAGNGTDTLFGVQSGGTFYFEVPGVSVIATMEGTHGRLTSGGAGSDVPVTIGPLLSFETSYGGIIFGTVVNQVGLFSDGTTLTFSSLGAYALQWQTGGNLVNIASTNFSFGNVFAGGVINFIANNTTVAQLTGTSGHGLFTVGGNGSDFLVAMGPRVSNSTTDASFWLLANGSTPSSTNMVLDYNGSTLVVNTPGNTDTIAFYNGLSSLLLSATQSVISIGSAPLFEWAANIASPTISQAQSTSGAGGSLYMFAQAAKTSSGAAGGNLILSSGAGDGAGAPGQVLIANDKASIETIIGYNTGVGAGTTALVGNPVSIQSYSGGGSFYVYAIDAAFVWSGAYQVVWDVNNLAFHNLATTPILWQYAAVSDVATVALTIQAQSAYSSATVHLNGGDLILASGAQHGATGVPGVVHLRGGANDIAAFSATTSTTVATFYDYTGTSALTQIVNVGSGFIQWNTSSAYVMEWNVGSADMIMGPGEWAVGKSIWWISAEDTGVFFGSNLGTTVGLRIDLGTVTTPFIQAGSTVTSLGIGTNNSGASLTLQAGAATTVLTLTASGSPATPIAEFAGSVKYDNVALPSTPTGGPVVFGFNGALQAVGTSGTITTLAPAEPHCDVCGSDFVVEYENPKYGYFMMCMKCLGDHHGDATWIRRAKKREA